MLFIIFSNILPTRSPDFENHVEHKVCAFVSTSLHRWMETFCASARLTYCPQLIGKACGTMIGLRRPRTVTITDYSGLEELWNVSPLPLDLSLRIYVLGLCALPGL